MNRLASLRKAQGWSQYQLYRQMAKIAEADGHSMASWESMKGRISKWENGHVIPGEFYLGLLCVVLGVGEADLGFTESAGLAVETSQVGPVSPLAVTPEVVAFLNTIFPQYTNADRMLGPRAVIGVVREQCRMIETLVAVAREPIRSDVLHIGAKFFEFGGWLAQDSGDFEAAANWSSRALDMAYETGDQWLVSYIFMRRSNIATDAGNPSEGIGLARAALRDGARLGPKLRALAYRQQANALALTGDARGCSAAIAAAIEASHQNDGEPEPGTTYCTPSYIGMEGAAAWAQLGRPDRAVTLLTDALHHWPEADQRDRSIGQARLAYAYAMGGKLDAACAAARRAAEAVKNSPSTRAIRELERVRKRLTPWRKSAEVIELTDFLRELPSLS